MRGTAEEYLTQYGANFREKRLQSELTQREVAKFLNISQAIISHIETGKMLPPIEIEDALNEIYRTR